LGDALGIVIKADHPEARIEESAASRRALDLERQAPLMS
jgi:hypothetical protein